jgi:ribose 5-phosphate isomerase B
MSKELVTERTIRELIRNGIKRIEVAPGTVVTPLAIEAAQSDGVKIIQTEHKSSSSDEKETASESEMTGGRSSKGKEIVVFGSDHGGYQLKEMLKKYAEELGYVIMDVGTSTEEACDYPDFAYAVAKAVSVGEAWRGVMIDGAGIGSCVVANKVPRIRAACCHNEFVARNAREHNDANVLTLGSRATGAEVCKEILRIWLETWFSGGRHKRRVDKIADVERHCFQS